MIENFKEFYNFYIPSGLFFIIIPLFVFIFLHFKKNRLKKQIKKLKNFSSLLLWIKIIFLTSNISIFIQLFVEIKTRIIPNLNILLSLLCLIFILLIDKEKNCITNSMEVICKNNNKQKKTFYISIFASCLIFFVLGIYSLGKFMTVDEPKWINTRIPQLFNSIKYSNWENTYINDKPGILPSYLAGIYGLFNNYNDYKKISPENFENFLFWLRLPILLFNVFLLPFLALLIQKIYGSRIASLSILFISTTPILIGISRIINPDATLWITSAISLLSFLVYQKENNKKYLYASGIFLGLACASKFFASIIYLIFLFLILAEYLYLNINTNTFKTRFLDLINLIFISILTYSILFPYTWVSIDQSFKGTIAAGILTPIFKPLLFLLIIIFFDLFFLKSKLLNTLKNKAVILKIIPLILLITLTLGILNYLNLINLFDFSSDIVNQKRSEVNFIKSLIFSQYSILTTLSPIAIILFIIFLIKNLFKKTKNLYIENIGNYSFLLLIISLMIGGAINGFYCGARYQIMLYPFYAILISYFILNLKKNNLIKTIIILYFISSLYSVFSISPYYYVYTNLFNYKKYNIVDSWGLGGYEMAKWANSLENAKNLNFWTDREGFNSFFVGNTYWRGSDNPFNEELNIDYLVLTNGGERIFKKALIAWNNGKKYFYAFEAANTPILEYYKKEPEYTICINNKNCISVIKK